MDETKARIIDKLKRSDVRRHVLFVSIGRDWVSNRSTRRYLTALVAGWLGCEIRHRVIENKRRYDRGSRKAEAQKPDAGACTIKADNKIRHPTEEEHRSAEEAYWKRSIIATWIAVLVAAGAAIFSYRAFHEAQRQANAAEDQNRPWIAVTGIDLQNLSFLKGAVAATIAIKFKNIGHSPAQRILSGFRITTDGDTRFGPIDGQSICMTEVQSRQIFTFEDLAFPDGGEQTRLALNIRQIADLVSINTINVEKALASIRVNNPSFTPAKSIDYAKMPIELRGCITYISTEGGLNKVHGTSFSYHLFGPSSPGTYGLIDISSKTPLTLKDLILVPSTDGVFAN